MACSAASRALWLLVCALVTCQVASVRPLTELTPREKVQLAFKEITTLSNDLRLTVQKITVFNAPLQGPAIAQGFFGIIERITEYTANIPSIAANPDPFNDADAELVVQSLTTFVQVHQALLNVVIGKHGLVTLVPFFEPIRVALVTLEAAVDQFAYKLIALIPTQKPAADAQFASLTVTVSFAISTYSSPLNSVAGASLAQEIADALKEFTTLSSTLRQFTEKINLINAPLQGYMIPQGLANIITKVGEATSKLLGLDSKKAALGDDDAKAVVSELKTFVQVHQELLNVLIGKHGVPTLVVFFEPIRQSLISLETTVDTFAFYLVEFIPSQKAAAEEQFKALDGTVSNAIHTYEQPLLSTYLR